MAALIPTCSEDFLRSFSLSHTRGLDSTERLLPSNPFSLPSQTWNKKMRAKAEAEEAKKKADGRAKMQALAAKFGGTVGGK